MKAALINVGDRLVLKPDNPYGYGAEVLTVAAITYPKGYRTPWIYVQDWGSFRPSDFQGHANLERKRP